MARGRDATDTALTTTFGPARLAGFQVHTDEVPRLADTIEPDPLLDESALPFGAPAFRPHRARRLPARACTIGIAEAKAEIEAIATDPGRADFRQHARGDGARRRPPGARRGASSGRISSAQSDAVDPRDRAGGVGHADPPRHRRSRYDPAPVRARAVRCGQRRDALGLDEAQQRLLEGLPSRLRRRRRRSSTMPARRASPPSPRSCSSLSTRLRPECARRSRRLGDAARRGGLRRPARHDARRRRAPRRSDAAMPAAIC